MAVIKSGNSSDQWQIDPVSQAGRVTLYTSSGAVWAPTVTVDTTVIAKESSGNLELVRRYEIEEERQLLTDIRAELRIMNSLLVRIANAEPVFDLDIEYRQDPYYIAPNNIRG